MKLRFRLALCALLILIVLPFAAQAGGTYTLNVGDTLTLYASTGGKAVTSYAWYSNDSASVHVLNPRSNPCQIEVIGPSTFSSGVIVQCDYSYIIQNGSFSYLASGMDSFHIYVNTPTPRPTVRPTPTPVRTPTPVPTATPVPTPTPTPRPANACGDNCRWSLSNGKLTITGTGAMFDYTASAQQPWAGQAITSVHIGEGVTHVGHYSFAGCGDIRSVSLPSTVTSIGKYAFSETAVTRIALPDGLTELYDYAFRGCQSLESIEIPEGVTKLNAGCFMGCTRLSAVRLPDMLTHIYSYAFQDCSALRYIHIPDSVTSISSSAFKASGLRQIHLSSSLTFLGDYAFAECTRLESLIVPKGVKKIDNNTLLNCTSLKTAAFLGASDIGTVLRQNASVKTLYVVHQKLITGGGLYGTGLTHIYTTDTKATWNKSPGLHWKYPSTAKITFGYTYGDGGEKDRSGQALTLPSGLTSLEAEALSGSAAYYIVCPDGLQSIGSRAFANSAELCMIEIPASVTSIANDAFAGCSSVRIYTTTGSEAEAYAARRGIPCTAE